LPFLASTNQGGASKAEAPPFSRRVAIIAELENAFGAYLRLIFAANIDR
jgi:hypothetical protein